jgi:hypothetical protein
MSEIAQLEVTPALLASSVGSALAQSCQEAFGASLRAVILTGSMARNEVSYTCAAGQAILLSDVEAIVVLHDASPLPARQRNTTLCGRVKQLLVERGVLVDVSLSIVHVSYLRNLPPHIYSYELHACGLVISGDAATLEEIPNYASSELTMEDAWRLLSNRLIEQIELMAEPRDENQLRYRSIKLCLDLATSLLVFFGEFEAGYCARLQRLERLGGTIDAANLPFSMSEFLPLVRQCVTAKLHPDTIVHFGKDFAEQISDWAWQSWRWQLKRMTDGIDTTPDILIRAFGRRQSLDKLLRGWLHAVRRIGWLSSARYGQKWLSLSAGRLTPRHAIYLAAYEWTQSRHGLESAQGMSIACDLLPVTKAELPISGPNVLRQICWNYHTFVTETRA